MIEYHMLPKVKVIAISVCLYGAKENDEPRRIFSADRKRMTGGFPTLAGRMISRPNLIEFDEIYERSSKQFGQNGEKDGWTVPLG
jgi:hypothetical protein